MNLVTINYLLVYFITACIIAYFCKKLFMPKASFVSLVLGLLILYGAGFALTLLENVFINLAYFLISNILFILLFYDVRWYSAIFYSIIASCMMVLGECIVILLNNSFFVDVFNGAENSPYFLFLSLLSKFFYFILMCIVILIKKKNTSEHKEFFHLIIVPVFSLWLLISVILLCLRLDISEDLQYMLLISSAMIIVLNIYIFNIYDKFNKQAGELSDKALRLQNETDKANYFKALSEQIVAKNTMIHDQKKMLTTLKYLNNDGGSERVDAMINELLGSSAFTPDLQMSDNDILNGILSRYSELFKEKEIVFHADIRSKVVDFLSDVELTSLFSNMLDNALTAAADSNGDRFADLMAVTEDSGIIRITLINSCKASPLDKKNALPRTTKKDKEAHGWGLKSMESVVKNHHGIILFDYKDEESAFYTLITMKG